MEDANNPLGLPPLDSVKPTGDVTELETILLMTLKLRYSINIEAAQLIQYYGEQMFHKGCIKGAELVISKIREKLAVKPSSTTPAPMVN